MESVPVFLQPDMREIDYRSGHLSTEEPDLWPPFDPQDPAMKFNTSRELDISPHSLELVSSMQRYSTQEHLTPFNSFPWITDLPKARSHPMPSVYDGPNPVPYNLAIPRDTSPDGWWGGERPAVEQDSSSGGSTWSPRTSEGRSEIDVSSLRQYSRWAEPQPNFLHGPSSISKSVAYPSPSLVGGIALREIQQYPDVESEELSVKSPDAKRENPYFFEPSGLYQSRAESIHYVQEDEGIGSSIQEDDDDMVMEDDQDDVSDYIPTEPKRGHRRNLPRSTAVSSRPPTITSPMQKRSPRSKNSSLVSAKPGSKVTKRPNTKTLAPTPSPTSPTVSLKSGKSKCDQCTLSFPSVSALHKHTLASHTRPFACSFHMYGCSATFGSKNEWKRHVSSQHLRLGIYRCDIDQCVPQPKTQQRRRKSSAPGAYADNLKNATTGSPGRTGTNAKDAMGHNDFNRKDLFTQHVRRMHGPPSSSVSRADKDAFDASLEAIRVRCWIPLRDSPPRSRCGFCSANANNKSAHPDADGATNETQGIFEGPGSWDERMEHVGKHLEKGLDIRAEQEDVILREWMLDQGLVKSEGTGWKVVGCGTRRRGKNVGGVMDGGEGDGEEEGEGEDE